VKIKVDDKKVKDALKRLKSKNNDLYLRVGKLIAEEIVNNIVENKLSGQVLKRQSGTWAKSIN